MTYAHININAMLKMLLVSQNLEDNVKFGKTMSDTDSTEHHSMMFINTNSLSCQNLKKILHIGY